MSELTKAALERSKRTAIEYVCASIPAGVAITPAMLQNFDVNTFKWIAIAWVVTGVLQVGGAFFWGLKQGLPEAEGAREMTSAEAVSMPVVKYDDEDDYDYLRIDETVDEGDDDEVEQE